MGNRVVAVLARDVGPFLARVSSIPLRLFFWPAFLRAAQSDKLLKWVFPPAPLLRRSEVLRSTTHDGRAATLGPATKA